MFTEKEITIKDEYDCEETTTIEFFDDFKILCNNCKHTGCGYDYQSWPDDGPTIRIICPKCFSIEYMR